VLTKSVARVSGLTGPKASIEVWSDVFSAMMCMRLSFRALTVRKQSKTWRTRVSRALLERSTAADDPYETEPREATATRAGREGGDTWGGRWM
jgi:hypothetical protein